MITIDGSKGEGGGQVLCTALAAAMATGEAVCISNIRAGRERPGLLRQHLTCLRAATEISGARSEGAQLGASEISFAPGAIRHGTYEFAIGTAGSVHLVLQTVLPALITASGPSRLVLEGGTHNPAAPPYEFIERTWLPVVAKMGANVALRIERYGFMPAGGGRIVAEIEPVPRLRQIELMERGARTDCYAEGYFSNLPVDIVERELETLGGRLGLAADKRLIREVRSQGPGNVLMLTMAHEHVTETVTGFGQRGISAEAVASGVASIADQYLKSSAAAGAYLSDQLLLPMALAGGGRFTALRLTRHAVTNIDTIQKMLEVRISREQTKGSEAEIVTIASA